MGDLSPNLKRNGKTLQRDRSNSPSPQTRLPTKRPQEFNIPSALKP